MIKITITSIKVDSSFVEENTGFVKGDTAYYVIRESGKRISSYFFYEHDALVCAWQLVKQYGLTLVEPW
jgi:hypothetical protein